jgi:methionyl-tRNA formyltransferase
MPASLRLVFMGTPTFAVPSLEALDSAGHRPVAVVTSPDAPGRRGKPPTPPPVKQAAERLGIEPVLQPESPKDAAFLEQIQALDPDLLVVVAFKILPPAVFEAARLGAFNLHGSLLPRYRGAAPIQRAVMSGDEETGLTTFALAVQVDTGGIILQQRLPLDPDWTSGDLHDRMMTMGADLVVETVERYARGEVRPVQQDDRLATPAPKLFREEGEVDWAQPASRVRRLIHGFSPAPGAWTVWRGEPLKLYRAALEQPETGADAEVGEVAQQDDRAFVRCGEGWLELIEVQPAGRRRQSAAEFVRGASLEPGERLGA